MSNQRKTSRRTPEEARREILEAAQEFLAEEGLSGLNVSSLMNRTDLGRSSFYVYFDDVQELVRALLDGLVEELWRPAHNWLEGEGDPRTEIRRALKGVVAVWEEHGPVLRAIAEAALVERDVGEAYREKVLNRFIDAVEQRLETELAAGNVGELPTGETATALILLNERYLMEKLGRPPFADSDQVLQTLDLIWSRTLYAEVD